MNLRRMLPVFSMLAIAAAITLAGADEPPKQPVKTEKSDDTKPDDGATDATKNVNRAALEREFSQKLTGATLVGYFTSDGQKSDKPPSADRYKLEKVSKLYGDHWMFVARMKVGENEIDVPMTLQVLWAGDTPMISLTDFTIPAMGTYTSRVMFYGDRYAGTWQHGKAGGHMWGRIEPAKKSDPAAKKPDGPADKQDSNK